MARADRRRATRARPAPGGGPGRRYQQSAYVGTEGLFFQRLRAQAKWAFVFLALVFGVGFVAFGVGSDVQGGVADVLGIGRSASGQPSVEDARERLRDNPGDPAALRDLSRALQTEGKPDEAIAPLREYTQVRPKDESALRELAGLHLTKAARVREQAQQAQLEAQFANPATEFLPPPSTPLGQALARQPITDAVAGETSGRLQRLIGELQQAYTGAKVIYQRLAVLRPDDPSIQFDLAQFAQNAGDTQTAIGAYRRFVELAPDDPNAERVRQEIKRLEQAPTAGGFGVPPGG